MKYQDEEICPQFTSGDSEYDDFVYNRSSTARSEFFLNENSFPSDLEWDTPQVPRRDHEEYFGWLTDNCVLREHRTDGTPHNFVLDPLAFRSYCKRMCRPDLTPIVDPVMWGRLRRRLPDEFNNRHIQVEARNMFVPERFIPSVIRHFLPRPKENSVLVEKLRVHVRKAIRDILLIDKLGSLKSSSHGVVLGHVSRDLSSKAAGYPYICKKGDVLSDPIKSGVLKKRIGMFRNGTYPDGDGPFNMSFVRTQASGKHRLV